LDTKDRAKIFTSPKSKDVMAIIFKGLPSLEQKAGALPYQG